MRAAHLFPVPPTWLKPADMSRTYSAPSIRSFPDKPHCSVVRKEPRIVLRRSRGAVGGLRVVPGSSPVPRWKALEASYLRGEAGLSCAQGQRRRWDKPQSRDPASAEFCAAQNFGRNGY